MAGFEELEENFDIKIGKLEDGKFWFENEWSFVENFTIDFTNWWLLFC